MVNVDPADPAAVDAAQQEQQEAQDAYDVAKAELSAADAAYSLAADAAYAAPDIVTLETQFDAALVSFDDAFTRLGLTEGTDPEQLIALADAAIAACSAPVIAPAPIARAVAPQQRGLNIQTAAHDAGAADPANLSLLAGLAGFGALSAAAAVVVRRQRTGRA